MLQGMGPRVRAQESRFSRLTPEYLEHRWMLSVSPTSGLEEILLDWNDSAPAEVGQEDVPSVPADSSFAPHTDCPGLDGDYCLPGDADGSGTVDFSDFLLLEANYGMSGASWQDGDFDGDGMVSFDDFVILANAY